MKWLTHDVLLISLSAFFADAGYQALIAGFPIFLVIYLHAPAYYLGIVMAFAYGIGSLFAYFGGKLADRLGKKVVALLATFSLPFYRLQALLAVRFLPVQFFQQAGGSETSVRQQGVQCLVT